MDFKEIPRIYPILDAGALSEAGIAIDSFARDLRAAGIRFLQYRDKESSDLEFIRRAAQLRAIFPAADSTLILNDRVHLHEATRFDGVHVGQEDTSVREARARIGSGLIGLSTHNIDQLQTAAGEAVDYVAIGPVFSTRSKYNADPMVGLDGIRSARALTSLPLVAIGGITLANVRDVFAAGADSVALISALLPAPARSTSQVLADFLARIG